MSVQSAYPSNCGHIMFAHGMQGMNKTSFHLILSYIKFNDTSAILSFAV